MNTKIRFFQNINTAEQILNVVKIRVELQPLRKRLIFPTQRPLVSMVREINPEGRIATTLKLVDETVDIAVPLLLVFSVSCLEHYLAQVGPYRRELSRKIKYWEGEVDTRLIRDAHETRIKRNIIVHSPERKIDPKAEDDAKKCGISGYKQGELFELNVEQVRQDLNKLRSFVEAVDRIS